MKTPFKKKIVARIKKWAERYLTETESNIQKKLSYEHLSPVEDVKQDVPYYEALAWALNEKEVKNIAVSGPYGSGKSSVLRTFEKKYPDYHYLNISLATFGQDIQENVGDEEKRLVLSPLAQKEADNEASRLIELSILQQMFYRVNDQDIPDSRFKRIRSISTQQIWWITTMVILAGISLLIVLWPKFLSQFSWWNGFDDTKRDYFAYGAFAFLLPISILLVSYLIRTLNRYAFNKVNLAGGEIEINPKNETSILNKHLDEILYFFEKMSYDVVVIEDLDRFNDPEIFTKLRELNLLINQSKNIKAKKQVKFIYAIRDDMFQDKARTKFFDFIIPIIPIISGTNSLDLLLNTEGKKQIIATMPDNYLTDIMLYVDDMRIMKNIFNEYLIYAEILKNIQAKPEKLFSIITYKNFYPGDFAALHDQKGLLYTAFENKAELRKKLIEEKQQQIHAIRNEISNLTAKSDLKVVELNKIYLFELRGMLPHPTALKINELRYEWDELASQDKFENLLEAVDIEYFHFSISHRAEQESQSTVSFKRVEEEVDSSLSYLERLDLTKKEHSKLIQAKEATIVHLKQSISDLEHYTLAELLSPSNAFVETLSPGLSQKKLLLFLLRNGYIDDMYKTFTSYFYEGKLLAKDMEFLMSLKNHEPLGHDFQIPNIDNLFPRTSFSDFRVEAALNHQVFDYLLSQRKSQDRKLETLLVQLERPSANVRSFLESYSTAGKQAGRLFGLMVTKCKVLFSDFITQTANGEVRDRFFKLILLNANIDDILAHPELEKLKDMLSARSDIASLFHENEYPTIQKLMDSLKTRMDTLSHDHQQPNELIDWLYAHDRYKINFDNIEFWFHYKLNADEEVIKQLKLANYTTIQNSKLTQLIQHVDNYINYYTEYIINEMTTNIEESQDIMVKLLTDKDIFTDNKRVLIQRQKTLIPNIKDIDPTFWPEIINHQKLMPTWENVMAYYLSVQEFDWPLIDFLDQEHNAIALSKSSISLTPSHNHVVKRQFAGNLIEQKNLSLTTYMHLVGNLGYQFDISSITVEDNQLAILITQGVINWSLSDLEAIKQDHAPLHLNYIEKNSKDFFKQLSSITLEGQEYQYLLTSKKISNSQKLELIGTISVEVITSQADLGETIASILSSSHFLALSFECLTAIFETSDSTMNKLKIFDLQLSGLSNAQLDTLIPLIGIPYNQLAKKAKTITLDENPINKSIIQKLHSKQYITKPKVDKGQLKFKTKNAS